MKICITSKEESPESNVEKNFGRTPYIAIYDCDTKNFTFTPNTNRNLAGGVGPKTAQMVIDSNADILMTGLIGENAKNVIDAAKIRLLIVSPEKTIKEAVSDFEKDNPVN